MDLFNDLSSDPSKKRNALLAKLEFSHVINKKASESQVQLLWDYFDNFKSKPVCFSDMSVYVSSFLSKGKAYKIWSESLSSKLKESSASKLLDERAVNEFANLLKLKYLTDEVAALHGHSTKHDDSPKNSIDLLKFFIELGAYLEASSIYSSLSIKNIQTDSLSYLILGQGGSLGMYQSDNELCYSSLQIYDSNTVDTPHMVTLSYQNNAYDKTIEFVDFHYKLKNSFQGLCTLSLATLSEIISHEDPKEIIDMLKFSNLPDAVPMIDKPGYYSDNRDFSLLPCPSLSRVLSLNTEPKEDQQKSFIKMQTPKFASIEQSTRSLPIMSFDSISLNLKISHALYYVSLNNIKELTRNSEEIRSLLKKINGSQALFEGNVEKSPSVSLMDSISKKDSLLFEQGFSGLDLIKAKIVLDLSSFAIRISELSNETNDDTINATAAKTTSQYSIFSTLKNLTNFLINVRNSEIFEGVDYLPQFIRKASLFTECYTFVWIFYKSLSETINNSKEANKDILSKNVQSLHEAIKSHSENILSLFEQITANLKKNGEQKILEGWFNLSTEIGITVASTINHGEYLKSANKVRSSLKDSWIASIKSMKNEIIRRPL
ncbi:N-alpha-acetyltransferase 25, NatB auxiliary subunit [Smittium culicis]|uniref:N-alpha-acetyltransferase 25, NatB auxiliary subunit n=1 Tax=Smittium culicis TaxID=133412 RepID=A0A1R1XLT1_9FUNG|nr:N-alpha-acetyltransferase 25, NatB auxiliary subunit [Smittium culicis]